MKGQGEAMVKFKKRLIDRYNDFEAASVCDINNDGIPDIVCGQYWYEGPHYLTRHQIQNYKPIGDNMQDIAYEDDFSDFPMDVNGDGKMDIVTGSFFNCTVKWLENPGKTGELWKVHDIVNRSNIETIRYYDIDNCGTAEIFPNNNNRPPCFIKLVKDANGKGTGEFIIHELNPKDCPVMGHGIGFGDINGDGLIDVITAKGWLENPGDPFGTWIFHDDFNFEKEVGWDLSCPAVVFDVDGNGINDIICSRAHLYGLFWFEQKFDAAGNRYWVKHVVDGERSSYHDMQLVDIDNDGELELVTGKRWMAHCGNDPGDKEDCFIYIFKIRNGKFEKYVVDEGPAEKDHSGTGIYFWVEDTTGNGYKDIVCPGKEGLFIFENLGEE